MGAVWWVVILGVVVGEGVEGWVWVGIENRGLDDVLEA